MSHWIDIAALEAIPRRGARVVKTAFGCIAIFRTQDDQVYAVEDRCPHKQGPLSEGIVHGHSVTCPLHNLVIDLRTGQAQDGESGAVTRFAAEVKDGRILLDASFLRARTAA